MKVLQNSAHNQQLRGNAIQGFGQQQILQTPYRENKDRYLDSDRYQSDSISSKSSKKPIIEFDVQISQSMSSKIVIFEDSVPEILVEDLIAQNQLKPQAFNPILRMVLENMKKVEESRQIFFSNLKDDASYEALMKKQQALCQEYQQTKEMLRLEKLRGELLVNSSKIKVAQYPPASQKVPYSPPQRDHQEEKKPTKQRSFTPTRETNIIQKLPVSKTPRQRTEIADNSPKNQNKSTGKNSVQQYEPNKQKLATEGYQPLLFFYDHLNPQKQLSTSQGKGQSAKQTKNVQNSQRGEMPRNQFKERHASPLQVQAQKVKKSPLKYSNEETYAEKGARKRNYQDPKNVTERLHYSGKDQRLCSKEHHSQDRNDKECTFKPKINNNSELLSKLYYQRLVTPQPTPFNEEFVPAITTYKIKSLSEIEQIPDPDNEIKKNQPFAQRNIDHSMQTSDIEREIGIQTSNSLNRPTNNIPTFRETNPLGNQQFNPQFPSSPNQNLRYFNRYEETDRFKEEIPKQTMGVQTSSSLNPQQVESTQTYQNPIRVIGVQTSRSLNPNQQMAVQTSSSLNPSQSAGVQATAPTKVAFMQTFSIAQQSLGIQTSQGLNPRVQAGVQTQQEEPILKKSMANQTSQIIVPKLSASIQTSDNFNRERISACAQTSQSFKASKHSMAMQTSEQEQESSFREQNENQIDFDPHLNKNYFKYLQMQEEIEQEANNKSNPLFDQESHYTQAQQSLSQYLPPQQHEQPPIKQSVEIQTSDWLLNNDNPSVKSSSSHSKGPENQVPFDPHINKNYFKFLKMEEEKENEKANPNYILNRSLSEFGNLSPSKNYQYDHSINEGAKPNSNSHTEQSFSNPHQSYSNLPIDQGTHEQINSINNAPKQSEQNWNPQNQSSSQYPPIAKGNQDLKEPPAGIADPTKESVYYQQEGSVYYCDEDAMILQSDHPFGSLGGSSQPRINNHQMLKSHGKISTSSQSEQKPDTAISCVRSVSPRIDTNAKPSALILSQQQVVVSISTPRLAEQHKSGNQFRQDNPFMVQSNSNPMLFQSKIRGKLSEEEQEALTAVFQELKNSSKDKTILRKLDIDTDQLRFGVVLRSHLEIIMRQFQPNEEITLESFFKAAEKSNSLSLFLSECQDFLNQMKAEE